MWLERRVAGVVAVTVIILGCSPGVSGVGGHTEATVSPTAASPSTSMPVTTTTSASKSTTTLGVAGPLTDPGVPSAYRFESTQIVEVAIPGDLTSRAGYEIRGQFVAPISFDYQFDFIGSPQSQTTRFVSKGFETFSLQPNQPWRKGAPFAPISRFSNSFGAVNPAIDVTELYAALADDDWIEESLAGREVRSYTLMRDRLDEIVDWRGFVADVTVVEVGDTTGTFYFDAETHHLVGYDIDAELDEIDDDSQRDFPEGASVTVTEDLRISRVDEVSSIDIPHVEEADAPEGFAWLELPDAGLRLLYPNYLVSSGASPALPDGFTALATLVGVDGGVIVYGVDGSMLDSYVRLADFAEEFAFGVRLTGGPTTVTEYEVGDEYVGFVVASRTDDGVLDHYLFTDGSRIFIIQVLILDGAQERWGLTDEEIEVMMSSVEMVDPIAGSST